MTVIAPFHFDDTEHFTWLRSVLFVFVTLLFVICWSLYVCLVGVSFDKYHLKFVWLSYPETFSPHSQSLKVVWIELSTQVKYFLMENNHFDFDYMKFLSPKQTYTIIQFDFWILVICFFSSIHASLINSIELFSSLHFTSLSIFWIALFIEAILPKFCIFHSTQNFITLTFWTSFQRVSTLHL